MNITAALLAVTLWTAAEAHKPQIQGLALSLQTSSSDSLVVELDFRLENALEGPLRERIESGLPTTILYEMHLVRERRWWLDRKIVRSTLEVTASYDAVTMEYQIYHRLNDELIASRVVQDFAELRPAMTRIQNVPAFKLQYALGERPAVVRVRADLGSRTWLALVPVRITTEWAESPPLSSR